jgi:nitrate reductase delta subunit
VRDDSLEALDAEWEEEMVTFLNGDKNSFCGTSAGPTKHKAREEVAVPVHWVDFKQSAAPAGKA